MNEEEIAHRLREAGWAHQPDRARMLARVERGMAGPAVRHRVRPIRRSGPRVVLAAMATAGILATGGLAVAAIVQSSAPPSITPSVTSSPSATSGSRTPSADPGTAGAAPVVPPTSSHPSPSASASASAASQFQNGALWSAGSVDAHSTVYWEQNNLTLRTTQPLTTLTVELRVALTANVQSTGSWQTLPGDAFTVTVQPSGGSLVYRWVLKPGQTVQAGQYEFAAQFNHATGARSAAGDSYRVDAQGPGSPASAVWGGYGTAH